MSVKDFGCLLIDNNRSRAYIQKLARAGLAPDCVLYVEFDPIKPTFVDKLGTETSALIDRCFKNRKYFLYDPKYIARSVNRQIIATPTKYASFNTQTPILTTLNQYAITHEKLTVRDINDETVIEALNDSGPKFYLFGGGGILRKGFFEGDKKIIHIHPGLIPYFRGSHCIEWSVLLKGKCYATAFYMTAAIDEGQIIARREYEPPELENCNIAPLYSAHIRSELALDIVRAFSSTGKFGHEPAIEGASDVTYFKMHPAMTNIVFHRLQK